jgi:hypothetical protein
MLWQHEVMEARKPMAITRINVAYEQATCGRCGGSGHYSYCQMYGTVCFKCQGRKTVTTKRGAKAADTYAAIKAAVLSVPTSRLRVGMQVFVDNPAIAGLSAGCRGWFTVRAVGRTVYGPQVARTAEERASCGAYFYPWKPGDNWEVDLGPKAGRSNVDRDALWLRKPSTAALQMMAKHMVGVAGATVTLTEEQEA